MYAGFLILLTTINCQQTSAVEDTALAKINDYRKSAGLEPVVLDQGLCKGCTAHAQYLVRYLDHPSTKKLGAHAEDPQLPGYSEDGRMAARAAFIYGNTPLATIDYIMSTFHARLRILDSDLKRVGLGAARDKKGNWITVLDTYRGRGSVEPILYPADKQKEVPLAFIGPESPNPVPKDQSKQAGYPITLTFPRGLVARKVTATLKDAEDKEVEVWFSSPEKPVFKVEYQKNTVALIAKDWLQPETTYTATVSAEVGGKPWKRSWSFTTGANIKPEVDKKLSGLERLNAYRKNAGLEPVTLDGLLTKGCKAHAQYLAKHYTDPITQKLGANDEDPKLPSYTAEGHQAGRWSAIHFEGPIESVDTWMARVFHRLALLNPDLKRVGIGEATFQNIEIFVMDVNRGQGNDQVLLFPGDQQKNIPLTCSEESPDPIPQSKNKRVGYPVCVRFPDGWPVKDVTATLKDSSAEDVPVWLLTPEKPAASADDQRNTVGLIAKQPLKPNARYTVTVSAKVGEEMWTKTWSFTTGKK